MDQHPDFRGHNMPLKLPMPDPGELEERFASVLVSSQLAGEERENRYLLFPPLCYCSPPPSCHRTGGHGQLCVCVERHELSCSFVGREI